MNVSGQAAANKDTPHTPKPYADAYNSSTPPNSSSVYTPARRPPNAESIIFPNAQTNSNNVTNRTSPTSCSIYAMTNFRKHSNYFKGRLN